MPSDRPKKAKTPAPREPTEAERALASRATERGRSRSARPEFSVEAGPDKALRIQGVHADALGTQEAFLDALGTRSHHFANQAALALATLGNMTGAKRTPTAEEYNAALALVASVEPNNELEAALAVQIATTHAASLDFLQRARLNAGEHFEVAGAYVGMATKLSRTMATHIEALAKLRNGGKSTHEVRYVYVNGPAAFGPGAKAAAAYGGGGGAENTGQCHAPLAIEHDGGEPCPPVWSEDAERQAVRGAGREGSEALSDARGHEPRRADGQGERRVHVRALDAGVAGGSGLPPRGSEAGEGNP